MSLFKLGLATPAYQPDHDPVGGPSSATLCRTAQSVARAAKGQEVVSISVPFGPSQRARDMLLSSAITTPLLVAFDDHLYLLEMLPMKSLLLTFAICVGLLIFLSFFVGGVLLLG